MAATEGVKELYMAASMEELNKKMSTANIDCSSPKLLVNYYSETSDKGHSE